MSAVIEVTVFSDVITFIHHPGSKASNGTHDTFVSDLRNAAAPETPQSTARHQFRADTGVPGCCGSALLLV